MTDAPAHRIPVDILTGFLGSGKTTLLNRVLRQPALESTAVIVNEFGEIGIDHLLVETSTEEMIELNNGCICCTIRGDLADKLGSLAMWLDVGRIPPVERVIVETTGLADPAPIMHTLMAEPDLLGRYRLNGVVTVVDGILGASSLDRFPEARKQVAIADRLVLSKSDLVATGPDRDAYGRLRARLGRLNPRASVHEAVRGAVDCEALFARVAEETEASFADLDAWLEAADPDGTSAEHASGAHDHGHGHTHDHGDIESFVVTMDTPVESEGFNRFLQDLALEHGERILRMKGIVQVADRPEQPAVVHGVQHVFFPVTWLDGWPDEDRSSRLVFIVQDLDHERIRRRFREHLAGPDPMA